MLWQIKWWCPNGGDPISQRSQATVVKNNYFRNAIKSMVSKESVFSCPYNQLRKFRPSNILHSIISKVTKHKFRVSKVGKKSFARRATNLRSPVKSVKVVGPRKKRRYPRPRVNKKKKRQTKWYSIWSSSPPFYLWAPRGVLNSFYPNRPAEQRGENVVAPFLRRSTIMQHVRPTPTFRGLPMAQLAQLASCGARTISRRESRQTIGTTLWERQRYGSLPDGTCFCMNM